MIFLPVGYPVCFVNNGGTYSYLIENEQGTYTLEGNEFMLWTGLLQKKSESELSPSVLNSLKEKKAIVYAESGNSLFSLLFTFKPVRQGVGGIAQNKYSIVLGEKNFFPSELQSDFWKMADGKKTVLEIMRLLSKNHSLVSANEKEYFVKQLKGLMGVGLLYLR